MVGIALTVVAAVGVAALAARLRTSRRRRARVARPSRSFATAPAGVKHLAATVDELSDLGLRLPTVPPALAHRHRLGVLLGLR